MTALVAMAAWARRRGGEAAWPMVAPRPPARGPVAWPPPRGLAPPLELPWPPGVREWSGLGGDAIKELEETEGHA